MFSRACNKRTIRITHKQVFSMAHTTKTPMDQNSLSTGQIFLKHFSESDYSRICSKTFFRNLLFFFFFKVISRCKNNLFSLPQAGNNIFQSLIQTLNNEEIKGRVIDLKKHLKIASWILKNILHLTSLLLMFWILATQLIKNNFKVREKELQDEVEQSEFSPREQPCSDTMLEFMSICLMSREYSVNL